MTGAVCLVSKGGRAGCARACGGVAAGTCAVGWSVWRWCFVVWRCCGSHSGGVAPVAVAELMC